MHILRSPFLLCLPLIGASVLSAASEDVSFSEGWRFLRKDDPSAASMPFDDSAWEMATLPHTARVEALVTGKDARQWQGVCWYRKSFDLPSSSAGKAVWVRFDGAMNTAELWVNGQPSGKFMGGYLPYIADITSRVRPGEKNLVSVRLDNRDNPLTGPKPLAALDFNLYSGLYRGAKLIVKDTLHITDPVLAGKVAGGGVFVTFPEVSDESATVCIKTHVKNAGKQSRRFALKNSLIDGSGKTVATQETDASPLAGDSDREITQSIRILKPNLWSPAKPHLYELRTELLEAGKPIDVGQMRIGVRRIEITQDGFRINGKKMFLRGCNRHQEYPYIGNALPDQAQDRDAWRIKQAGFDYIRLSHYPQSPAFLDACDELGIVVMNCLMGWQYFGKDPAFAELKYRECRDLIRRDRNHPCVVLWEVSLNESAMPRAFVERTHAIAHEEYPGDQMVTCGWVKGYDVFIQARQHGGCKKVRDLPCVVSEYGDWEYFAQNAGLEQHLWNDLQPAERSSRQLRGHGEKRLLQQTLNFQEAHNDNLKTAAFADGIWVMFDYNRGYAGEIEASGVMDIFRFPKFSYWFFRSQRSIGESVAGADTTPMVHIANYWTTNSPLEVRVFSNCEEVELRLNDKLIERRGPDKDRISTHIPHPPFTFKVREFEPGALSAIGYVTGKPAASAVRRTPGLPERLQIKFDLAGRPFAADGKDVVFTGADLLDANNTVVPNAAVPVWFGASGTATLIGQNPVMSEAGSAAILLGSESAPPRCAAYALCMVKENDRVLVLSAAASPEGSPAPPCEIRYTLDGKEPSADSPRYAGPLPNSTGLRATLFVEGKPVIQADARNSAPSTSGVATPVLTASASASTGSVSER